MNPTEEALLRATQAKRKAKRAKEKEEGGHPHDDAMWDLDVGGEEW